MDKARHILSLDQGTTSSRAIVFDGAGNACGMSQREFQQIYPRPGWVEHDPEDIWESQRASAAGAMAAYGGRVEAIGITNQRETAIVWERDTGRPICNAIVWQCRRTAKLCEELAAQGLNPYIQAHTGLTIDAYFSATKLKWILDSVPGSRERAERGELLFGTVDTWLIWKLTGGRVHVTDYTNASRTMLFDIHRLCWDEELCRRLDIPTAMLPKAVPSSGCCGYVAEGIPGLEALAGAPIAGIAGDQQAALVGQACFSRGEAKCTYGTGCFLMMNVGEKPILSSNGLITTIAYALEDSIAYALEGSVFNGGSVIQWLRDDLGVIASAPEVDALAAIVPHSNGVYMVPAFTGLGAPYWDMYARGTILGLTRGTGKGHIARAALESIAYQVADVIQAMERDSGHALSELRADGGASRSNLLMQFQSDLLSCAINRPQNVETTAFGAAILAGLAVGIYGGLEEIRGIWRSERQFTPALGGEESARLQRGWKRAVERALAWEEE